MKKVSEEQPQDTFSLFLRRMSNGIIRILTRNAGKAKMKNNVTGRKKGWLQKSPKRYTIGTMKAGYRYDPSALREFPAYNLVDASGYARVSYARLRYWIGTNAPLISIAESDPPLLSFTNLLELHVIDALRSQYGLRLSRIRAAVETLKRYFPHSKHPLVEMALTTEGIDLFDERGILNFSRGGQGAMPTILQNYLQRIELSSPDFPTFYPFVRERSSKAPKFISISPAIAFGRSVIEGTGITTAVIAARYNAGESIRALSEEYGRGAQEIEEAVWWEKNRTRAAA
jgi:uncharacterized protein (DUF433 family)